MSNSSQISLSLFFPSYNEELNIAQTIEKADQAAKKITSDYEILIIDDGSKDKTAEIVKDLTGRYPNLKLIQHNKNLGYGAALRSGFQNSSKNWIFFSDADLQFDLKETIQLIPYINEYSVIVGYRHNRRDHFMRSLNAWGWKILIRTLFGLKVHDVDCAFKLIKSSAIKPILPEVISNGAMFSAEILIRLKKAGYQIKEVPVTHYPRSFGSPTGAKLSVILRAFKELIKVRKELV